MTYCSFLINYFDVPFVEAADLFSFGLFFQVTMEQCIYRGCFYKNADGTNKIIIIGDKCLVPTDECLWKDPCDVKHGVKTRSLAEINQGLHLRTLTVIMMSNLSNSG